MWHECNGVYWTNCQLLLLLINFIQWRIYLIDWPLQNSSFYFPPSISVLLRSVGSFMQTDVGGLVSQIQDLQKKNAELEEEKNIISAKVSSCSIFFFHLCRIFYKKHVHRLFFQTS